MARGGILLVFISHTFEFININAGFCGKIGVAMLFCLSAYILCEKYYFNSDAQWARKNILKFYIKRLLRIYSCLICALIFGVVIRRYNIAMVINIIIMRKPVSHFWVLPIELIFYFIFPILCIAFRVVGNKISLVFLLISCIGIWGYYFGILRVNTYSFLYCLPMFLVGMIVSFVKHSDFKIKFSIKNFDIIMFLIMLSFIGIGLIYAYLPEMDKGKLGLLDYEIYRFLVNPIVVGILFYAIEECSNVRENLRTGIVSLRFLGEISYPFYLLHHIIDGVIFNIFGSCNLKWLFPMMCFCLSMALAIMMHEIVEKPFAKFLSKL